MASVISLYLWRTDDESYYHHFRLGCIRHIPHGLDTYGGSEVTEKHWNVLLLGLLLGFFAGAALATFFITGAT
jgi:hypothetical protein